MLARDCFWNETFQFDIFTAIFYLHFFHVGSDVLFLVTKTSNLF